MKKLLLACMLALGMGASAQVGPPQATTPNTLNGYGFAQSSGAYSSLSASRTIWQSGATLGTDAVSPAVALPSAFKYNNRSYSTIYISNNGFITFGAPSTAGTYTGLSTDLSTAANIIEGAIAGFATNLRNANTTTSEISYETVGTKFVIQFTDMQGNTASAAQLINFQIQLDFATNVVSIVYGNTVSGTATLTGQVGLRGAESSDVNNRTGNNWTANAIGTSTTSNSTIGTTNGTTVPASGLTFTFTPGVWLSAPTTYATLPYSENFSTWVDGNSTADLPNSSYWRTWPSRGDNSWRASDISTSGFTSANGWTSISGAATITAPAVAPTARFHSYNTVSASGSMFLYVDLSSGSPGNRIITFDYINVDGSDVLDVSLSTDGGVTFTSLGTPLGISATWTNKGFLTTSTASTAIIRFTGTGDNGSSDIQIDNLSIITSALPPACSAISTPANAATGVSVTPTISWNQITDATSYVLSIGTTLGGTDVMNAVNVGNVTTYTIPAASQLLYNTQYFVTVIPVNSYGSATGCTGITFTTKNITCPPVTAPAAAAVNVSATPTITWTAVTDATGYTISVGTTSGGTDVLNNFNVGNVLSYTFSTALSSATTYYYTVNAYTPNTTSSSCTVRYFSTACPAVNAPYTENFDTTNVGSSSVTNAPLCWSYIETSGSAGYGYVTTAGAPVSSPNAYLLFNSSATTGNVMLVSPQTTALSDGTKRVRFMAKAGGTGYTMQVGTMSDISTPASFTVIGASISLTTSWVQYIVNIPVGSDLNVAFRHGLGSTSRSVYIDNVSVEAIPACVEPTALNSSALTYKSAVINWAPSSSTPSANYDIIYSNVNTAPGVTAVPTVSNVSTGYTLAPLNPSTTYYVWVRANCGTATSNWAPLPTLTTTTFCPPVTAPANNATEVSLTPTITWTAVTGATGYKISMGTTSGATNILNNVDVGNVLTYTLSSPLNNSTTYYYTVNAYDADVTSQSCTVRAFTTICAPFTPSYTNTFDSAAGACWVSASGGTVATGSTGTTSYWAQDGFLNNGSAGSMKYNSYSTARVGWFKSPVFNLSAGGYRVKFDYGLTTYADTTPDTLGSDDVIQFIVSQDGGATWTVLQSWNAANSPTNSVNTYTLDLTGYTSPTTMFAFFASDGTVDDPNDVDFFVDNFSITTILATINVVAEKEVTVYPNPFTDMVNISNVKDLKSLSVVDMSGRLVKTIASPGRQINLSELKAGLYILKLDYKDGTVKTVKAIKK
ncbi:T9SS type A sorting domain-containing protein [Chryseobacterium sp. cx-311]|uniref:T9SS type A sorting domain-containing protein n=1 Tax=Marnyiella aurantia TaxID=2758037 RepID=UPI001AE1449C|nr:fibronectin type III domain-containing protein [Marnyiella aurantia]MBP0613063.1 T9SS type A sorting domain-containing protein [Marnyiella aurantia]